MFEQARVRAPRFIRAWPVLYRCVGDREWQRGLTMNISESGFLLEAVEPLPLGTLIEPHVDIPEPVGRLGPGGGAAWIAYTLDSLPPRGPVPPPSPIPGPEADLGPHGDRRAREPRAGVATCR